jgi:hypothetical protein
VVVLVASAGLNAWLLAGASTREPETTEEHTPDEAQATADTERAPSAAQCGERWGACATSADTCRKILAACQARFGKLRPAREIFLAGEHEPELEKQVQPEVARVYQGIDGLDWSLECRGGICRLDVYWSEKAHEAARAANLAIQSDPGVHQHFHGMSIGGGTPTVDVITREPLAHQVIHLDTREREDPFE